MPLLIDYPPIPKGVETFTYIETMYIVACPRYKNKKSYIAQSSAIVSLRIGGEIKPSNVKITLLHKDFSQWNKKQACFLGKKTKTTYYDVNYVTDGYNVSSEETKMIYHYYIPALKPNVVSDATNNTDIQGSLEIDTK